MNEAPQWQVGEIERIRALADMQEAYHESIGKFGEILLAKADELFDSSGMKLMPGADRAAAEAIMREIRRLAVYGQTLSAAAVTHDKDFRDYGRERFIATLSDGDKATSVALEAAIDAAGVEMTESYNSLIAKVDEALKNLEAVPA